MSCGLPCIVNSECGEHLVKVSRLTVFDLVFLLGVGVAHYLGSTQLIQAFAFAPPGGRGTYALNM